MRFKSGVKIEGFKPEIVTAIMVVNEIYKAYGKEFVITSGVEGTHMVDSKHYIGYAFDCRTRHLTESDKVSIKKDIIDSLTDEYDIVLEDTHIHVEFDNKG